MKIAIITGAGTGIGKACALELLKEGFAIVLAGRRTEPLEATAAEARASGAPTLVVPTDVADPAAVHGTPEQIERAFRDAFMILDRRISLFLSLPLSTLGRLAIKKEIDRIGKQ